MKKRLFFAIFILCLVQSCQYYNLIPTSFLSKEQSTIKLSTLTYKVQNSWASENIAETKYYGDWVHQIPQSYSYAHSDYLFFDDQIGAETCLQNRLASLNITFSDPIQVKPDSHESTTINICGKNAEVHEVIVYPSIEFEIDEETKNFYVFFVVDSSYFEFNLALDMRDIHQHELYETQFWEMIDSIECPTIEK